jgi:hypothetical protein
MALRFLKDAVEQMINFSSGFGNANVVFIIGRALTGHINRDKLEIFGAHFLFDECIDRANQALHFYEFSIAIVSKSSQCVDSRWTEKQCCERHSKDDWKDDLGCERRSKVFVMNFKLGVFCEPTKQFVIYKSRFGLALVSRPHSKRIRRRQSAVYKKVGIRERIQRILYYLQVFHSLKRSL